MSAELEPTDKLIGQVLADRYQILQRLGEGAMGAVYKARHVKVGRSFAVKVLHARLLRDAKVALRFEREAELAGRLRHANVVGVVDVGEIDGTRYMVMDFAEGPDLAQMLGEAPMPAERIIHLVRQMLEGLYHAHEQGLIHRDFKPENVIIERDTHGAEMPRIVDFGIALLRDAGDSNDGQGRLTTNGLVLGTPHYMAPEQAVADPIDHRIDLFALGIVIYEMLSGRLPFDGSGAEVARANLLLDPPPIAQRVPYLEVDPLLEAFARRLMAKKRDARPATAKAARELLDLIVHDRRAAAAVLGVPMSERAPAVTQPVFAQAPGPDAGAPPTARMKPTPQPSYPAAAPFAPTEILPAPPLAYGAPRGPDAERFLPTSIRTPLGWETSSIARRRAPWFIAAAVLGAAGIAAAVIVATSGDSPEIPAPSARVVMTPLVPEANAAPAPVPVAPVPIAVAPPPEPTKPSEIAAGTRPSETTTDTPPSETRRVPRATGRQTESRPDARPLPNGSAVRSTSPALPGEAALPNGSAVRSTSPALPGEAALPNGSAVRSTGHAVVETRPLATPIEVKADDGKTDARPSDAKIARPAETRPAEGEAAKPASKPAAAAPVTGVTPKAVSSLYLAVSKQLTLLPPDEAEELRQRWRRFNVQALMLAPQAERDRAAAELTEILETAVSRSEALKAPRSKPRP